MKTSISRTMYRPRLISRDEDTPETLGVIYEDKTGDYFLSVEGVDGMMFMPVHLTSKASRGELGPTVGRTVTPKSVFVAYPIVALPVGSTIIFTQE